MISIIVPIYNDEKAFEKFISQINKLEGDYELIFVITNRDLYLIDKYKDYRFYVSKKGRSLQMNLGAKKAKGDIFLFLHADSIYEDNILQEIEKSINKSPAGCLKLYFDNDRFVMRVGALLSRLRVKFRNIAFGDQGIFVKRELFYDIGGFEEIPIMEDYRFSLDIDKRNIKILQCNSKIITRAVRFEKGGMLKTGRNMKKLQKMYRKGVDPYEIAKLYEDIR